MSERKELKLGDTFEVEMTVENILEISAVLGNTVASSGSSYNFWEKISNLINYKGWDYKDCAEGLPKINYSSIEKDIHKRFLELQESPKKKQIRELREQAESLLEKAKELECN